MSTDPTSAPDGEGPDLRPPRLRIARRAMAWWALRALVTWGVLLAALIVAYTLWEPARVWLIAPIVAVGVILAVKLALEPWWRYRVHRWEVTEHATYAASGWIVREWRVSPTSRIQTVDAVRGPLEQLLGLSTLRVTTASSYGAVDVGGLDRATAEDAAARLAVVAELSEGDAT
ncbi:PH domain-containing protein [Pseudactinotalea sp.]|uniref:PH domain-containing protein n=1 Tax=Pseudactinotalea sp. TaxID=1926260 RepID=UPI003B3B19C9